MRYILCEPWLWGKTNGIPFWGKCTTQFSLYFSGDWDVHWGPTDLDFDPWPHHFEQALGFRFAKRQENTLEPKVAITSCASGFSCEEIVGTGMIAARPLVGSSGCFPSRVGFHRRISGWEINSFPGKFQPKPKPTAGNVGPKKDK